MMDALFLVAQWQSDRTHFRLTDITARKEWFIYARDLLRILEVLQDMAHRDECLSLQKDEYEVLQAVYPDLICSTTTDRTLSLEVTVELSDSHRVVGPEHTPTEEPTVVSALPPVLLDVRLPDEYPLYASPQVISLQTRHRWIPDVDKISRFLLDMWTPGEQVLTIWVEWLSNGTFLEDLDLAECIDGVRMIRVPDQHLIPILRDFDEHLKQAKFSESSFTCEICMTPCKGARCLRLSCSHVFCRSCLDGFWKSHIADGDLARVGCPDPACVKAHQEANEEEVKGVVEQHVFERWKYLWDKRAFERGVSAVYCPIPYCQAPVPYIPTEESNPSWKLFRTCIKCGFAFCSYCEAAWHGPAIECPRKVGEKAIERMLKRNPLAESPDYAAMARKGFQYSKTKLSQEVRQNKASYQLIQGTS
ncbi:translation termination inhibitor protein itt1 [Steccherinum ochraceum]|uniref:RBR-type E3 ubiquitin transferase n=1 Tax=Steccherinum ochraceum TaxID=92696 RepID=A0A4R0RZN9_9APHY|nr:translation termination inhibitor protein itt1 [Steccherinum ochraceum]